MSNNKEIVAEYNLLLEEEITAITETIDKSLKSVKLYGKLVLEHHNLYIRNRITDYIKDVFTTNGSFEYNKSYKLFVKDNIKNYIQGNLQDDKHRIVRAYFYNFKEAVMVLIEAETKLVNLEKQRVNLKTIHYLYRQYNWHMGTEMLTTGAHYPIGSGFRLKIQYKPRSNRVSVGKNRQKVDWGASFKRLKLLLKDKDNELLQSYRDKLITKAELIHESRPLFYNAETNEEGDKWLVYDEKDFDFWLVLKTYDSKEENRRFYGVTPANYIENITRSQSDFMKEANSIDDIIHSKLLGFRDKIFMLEKYDITHCLNKFKDDI